MPPSGPGLLSGLDGKEGSQSTNYGLPNGLEGIFLERPKLADVYQGQLRARLLRLRGLDSQSHRHRHRRRSSNMTTNCAKGRVDFG
jgi:hypothetical protein